MTSTISSSTAARAAKGRPYRSHQAFAQAESGRGSETIAVSTAAPTGSGSPASCARNRSASPASEPGASRSSRIQDAVSAIAASILATVSAGVLPGTRRYPPRRGWSTCFQLAGSVKVSSSGRTGGSSAAGVSGASWTPPAAGAASGDDTAGAAGAATSTYPFLSFSAIVLRTCAAAASADAYSFVRVLPSLPQRP
ncbi:hypothetical protein [Streptomyces sp. NPDC014734]|uniref:hypothetical protein n=1 Tax=Streptomyces sp. NPDC014734 TaxID=3364886 RepID=UPI0036F9242D